jgi:ketosteroid isomerase-like protein
VSGAVPDGRPVGTPDRQSATEDVLAASEACVAAFGAHQVDAYFACFEPSATFLFHTTDRLLRSRAEYEAEWATWEAEGFRVLSCVSSRQQVQLLGDGAPGSVAVLTHRVRTEVRPGHGADPEVQHERETIVWRRGDDGRWRGVHEHLSPDPAG